MKDRRRAETCLLTVYATLAQANSLCYKRLRNTNSRWHRLTAYATKDHVRPTHGLDCGKKSNRQ